MQDDVAPLRRPQEIINEHAITVKNLITRLEKKSRDEIVIANLDRLRKRINLLRSTMGEDQPIRLMAPLMKKYQVKILDRDEKFFMGVNARQKYIEEFQKEPTRDEEYIFELIDSIRGHYQKSPQAEKDVVYGEVLVLFNCCIEYELAVPSLSKK